MRPTTYRVEVTASGWARIDTDDEMVFVYPDLDAPAVQIEVSGMLAIPDAIVIDTSVPARRTSDTTRTGFAIDLVESDVVVDDVVERHIIAQYRFLEWSVTARARWTPNAGVSYDDLFEVLRSVAPNFRSSRVTCLHELLQGVAAFAGYA